MTGTSAFGQRIDVRGEFARNRSTLLQLLGSLSAQDWERPTAAAPWTVRDLVAHLLGDDLNRLSRSRDAHSGEGPRPGESLPEFIHRINDEWVSATARLSPAVLVAMLETTTPAVLAFWESADLDEYGDPVSWASSDPAPVWLDCARDYTEYWVHQEQIREATDRQSAHVPEELHAVLDTFLRAVPHTLDGRSWDEGAGLAIRVAGPGGGRWSWRHTGNVWQPVADEPVPGTVVRFGDAGSLWRLCTRMITPAEASQHADVIGDGELANQLFQIVSIIR